MQTFRLELALLLTAQLTLHFAATVADLLDCFLHAPLRGRRFSWPRSGPRNPVIARCLLDIALPPTRPQFHKPSARVSFGLPDPLSVQVPTACDGGSQIGDKLDRESVKGQAAQQPDPVGQCNADITNINA